MKLSTLKLTLVIAALMLVLAGIVSVIGGGPSAGGPTLPSDQISTTPDAAATPTNAPVTPPVTLTIKPPAHTPTPTLKPTPTPTPKPTPVPTPASRSLGSGSFRSDTGVPINLVCSWSAETNGSSTAVITVTAALLLYKSVAQKL